MNKRVTLDGFYDLMRPAALRSEELSHRLRTLSRIVDEAKKGNHYVRLWLRPDDEVEALTVRGFCVEPYDNPDHVWNYTVYW